MACWRIPTVYLGTLPLGTTIWSNPGNGSGVTKIVPAVPSATGVADVFAFQGDDTVQAITSDGLGNAGDDHGLRLRLRSSKCPRYGLAPQTVLYEVGAILRSSLWLVAAQPPVTPRCCREAL